MRFVYHSRYGHPELLTIRETTKPAPKDDELLIKVHAATINRTDCGILYGTPRIIRLFTGLFKPRIKTTGTDFAGVVETTGKNVTTFKPGDRVWGFSDLHPVSHAEYMTIKADGPVLHIPGNISFEMAAASPEGAHYANNFINKVSLKAGERVLVNGATGAIGSAMVQLLKQYDVHITAVCNTPNKELVLSLGANEVIDYLAEDFTKCGETFHYVFDAVGKSSYGKCKPLLLPGGIYISSELGPYMQNIYLPLITSFIRNKRVIFPVPVKIKASLQLVNNLLEQSAFKPVIDRSYTIEQVKEAFEYVASGRKTGNVILSIADSTANE